MRANMMTFFFNRFNNIIEDTAILLKKHSVLEVLQILPAITHYTIFTTWAI